MRETPMPAARALIWALILAACGGDERGAAETTGGEASSSSSSDEGTPASTSGAVDDSTTLPPLPPPGDGGPPTPSQSATCEAWVACAMALGDPEIDAIVDEFGSLGTCWSDAGTAAACDDACAEALDMARAAAEAAGEMLPDACDPPRDVPYSEIVAIIDGNCVDGCHEPGGEEASLDLSGDPRTELIEVVGNQATLPHVVAGDHQGSYLWHKVAGSQGSVGGMGARMPAGAPALTPEQVDAIADWIDVGAPP